MTNVGPPALVRRDSVAGIAPALAATRAAVAGPGLNRAPYGAAGS